MFYFILRIFFDERGKRFGVINVAHAQISKLQIIKQIETENVFIKIIKIPLRIN